MGCEISNGNGIVTDVEPDHTDSVFRQYHVTMPLGHVTIIVYVAYPAPVKASVDKDTDK
jgi:hypothetical protein